MATNKTIEAVLDEMDLIFGSRSRTMDILLVRLIEIMFVGQLCRSLRKECKDPEKLLRLWVNFQKAKRGVPGYKINTVRPAIGGWSKTGKFTDAEDKELKEKGAKQAPKIYEIETPD